MQKATFATVMPRFLLSISTFHSDANHKSSIQSLTLRFNVHGTLKIQSYNLQN